MRRKGLWHQRLLVIAYPLRAKSNRFKVAVTNEKSPGALALPSLFSGRLSTRCDPWNSTGPTRRRFGLAGAFSGGVIRGVQTNGDFAQRTEAVESMAENNVSSQEMKSSSSTRFDPLAFAMLLGVVVMITISLVNVWNLRRLGERVASLEGGAATKPDPGPDPNRLYTVRTEGAPSKGPAGAPVTIVEFSDFQCPYCARAVPTLKQIEDTYRGSVRIVWKHLPLAIHKDAVGAALAAQAAGNQGKFWELHDMLFADQKKLGPDDLKQYGKSLQLDMARFEADQVNVEEKKRIDADVAEARALGINGTPGFFINGRFVSGAQPFENFAKIIDEELTKRNLPVPSRASN